MSKRKEGAIGGSPKRSRLHESTPARGGPLPTSLSQVTAQKSREQDVPWYALACKTSLADKCFNSDKFLDGSIVRITLKNFMTYDDITLRPGPRMNFVIGPNGTGKSSLVCALAVGLSASTSVCLPLPCFTLFLDSAIKSGTWTRQKGGCIRQEGPP